MSMMPLDLDISHDATLQRLIDQALQVTGGHLMIGRHGYTLYFGCGQTLSGYGPENIKRMAIETGLPVIDTRGVEYDALCAVVITGPMIAVGAEPEAFLCQALSTEALPVAAGRYRAIGAELHNIPDA